MPPSRPALALTVLLTLLVAGCAAGGNGQARNYCPVGEERVCRKDVSRTESTGARLGSRTVCRCQPVAGDAADAGEAGAAN